MAKQTINIGTTANDGTGDQLRSAFDKVNDNTDEIYAGSATVALRAAPADDKGLSGDTAGMIASDATYIYVCHTTWTDGVSAIWARAAITSGF